MKLYGNDISFNSNKVRFAANAMGISYEFHCIDLAAGQQRTPEFLAINPAGRIPCLQNGDFVVFESNTIMRYLAEVTSSPFYPHDLEKRTIVNQWLDFGSIHVGGAMTKIFFNTIIYKFVGAEIDQRSLADGRQFLANFLKIVDAQLAKTPYIAGQDLSLADFNILAAIDPAEVTGSDLTPYKNVIAWRKKLQAQPFYQKVFPSFTDYLNGMIQKV